MLLINFYNTCKCGKSDSDSVCLSSSVNDGQDWFAEGAQFGFLKNNVKRDVWLELSCVKRV